MIFSETALGGVWRIEMARHIDCRGFFARTFDVGQFKGRGLVSSFSQASIAHNTEPGTIRGLHMQRHPYSETKLVHCGSGSIFDVVVDLREHSSTYLQYHAEVLTSVNGIMLYIPEGCCHGYQTLEPRTDVYYMISGEYFPQAQFGLRWDDPSIEIPWPLSPTVISTRDRAYEWISRTEES